MLGIFVRCGARWSRHWQAIALLAPLMCMSQVTLGQNGMAASPISSPPAPAKAVATAVLAIVPGASLKGKLGNVTATSAEIEAALMLPSALAIPRTAEQVRDAAELVLLPKLWVRSGEGERLSATEAVYVQQMAELGRLRGWYDVAEARAVRRLASDPKALEARAREVYREKLLQIPAPLVASITVLDVQFAKHGFDGSLARLRAVQEMLKLGQSFDAVVGQFSDDGPSTGSALTAPRETTYAVDRDQLEGALRTAVFRDLKPGEVSGPIPVATGFVVVRLNSRQPREKPTFESMRATIETEIRADAVSRARTEARHRLSIESAVLDQPPAQDKK